MAVGVRGNRSVMTVAYVVVLALAAAAAYWRLPAALDLKLMDAQMRFLRGNFPRPADNDVVIVGLDEPFLESMREPLALPRRDDGRQAGGGRPRRRAAFAQLPLPRAGRPPGDELRRDPAARAAA